MFFAVLPLVSRFPQMLPSPVLFIFSFPFNIAFYSLYFFEIYFPPFYLRALHGTSVDSSFLACMYLHKVETFIL